ncbi:MAG: (2Fe-2S)-binding protein [Clostridia bacterium]|nr:(2Fe-2S)-binding protein [Clostridia bacterium]
MKENYMVCNCKQVSYAAIADALHQNKNFSDVLEAFEDVKAVTHCSTGCGGCHDKVLDIISDILMGHDQA